MRDCDIRRVLRDRLNAQHRFDPEDARLLDELPLCAGAVRIDLALINGAINGYEIKSDRDTLERLPRQQRAYERVCDTITIVTSARHHDRVLDQVPEYWGLVRAVSDSGTIRLESVRAAGRNARVDPAAVVQLLWRDEALALLERRGLVHGLRSKPKRALWAAAARLVPLEELAGEVRAALKLRGPDWLAGAPRTQSDAPAPL